MSLFFKDDWKVAKNLTLNLGVRWDDYGVPYDRHGLMTLPVGGPAGIWGVSGSGFADWFKPGVRGAPTTMQFVGKNSPNPGTPWFSDDYKDFGPAVGFAWQVPWFGAGKTTVRGGYQMTYNQGQVANAITQENVVPGSTLNGTYGGDSSAANAYLDLTKVPARVPVIQIYKPLQPVPLTDRTQQVYNPQANLRNPYAENVTLSVTRSLSNNLTLDVRYIGTLGRRQWNSNFQINQPNFLYNGLKEAFDAARAGNDSSPALQVLENMFKGINIAGAGFGPVGSTYNGVLQTAGAQLRASAATSPNVIGSNLQQNLANGNYENVAAILNTMNYSGAFNPNLPVIPAGVNGAVMRYNNFPDNFIVANPQFSSVYLISDINTNNYHSLEAQITLRPAHGVSMQSTYTWSKNLGITGGLSGTYTDPLNRHADYAPLPDQRVHDFRTNGEFTLPIGPGKTLLGNSNGVLARIAEGWQAGWIFNANTGQPLTIAGNTTLYGYYVLGNLVSNGTPDIVGSFKSKGKVHWQRGAATGVFLSGTNGAALKQVKDPQCRALPSSLQGVCTLTAIADASTGQILLQNAQPGKRGNMGLRSIAGPGLWRFDTNLTKSFKISEGKAVIFRIDSTDVFNHAEPNTPVLNINMLNFGQVVPTTIAGITTPAKSLLHRQFLASLRFTF